MSFRVLLATFAASSTLLLAQSKPAATLSKSDHKFIEEAYQAGRTQIDLGNLAMQRGTDPQVKAFAGMVIKDHTLGNQAIEALAKDKGVTLPAEKESAAHTKLSKLSGHDFDKTYISDVASHHRKDIVEFEKAANNGTDLQVRSLATNMLPTLQGHLDRATELHIELGKEGTADRTTK